MEPVIVVDSTKCTGCEKCIEVCMLGVLYVDDFTGLCTVRHPENCDKNGACVKVCEAGAIRINR